MPRDEKSYRNAMHGVWAGLLMAAAVVADVLHGPGFPIYLVAVALGVAAGAMVLRLDGTRRQPAHAKHRRNDP